MAVLITGAGLIGCHAAKQLVDQGDEVALFDLSPSQEYIAKVVDETHMTTIAADLRDLPALIGAVKDCQAETIVHTAGLIGKRVAEHSYTGTTNNILGTIHVLEAARLLGVRRVVYVSTFGVYDRSKMTTGSIREDAPMGGHNLYTVTKACSEQLVGAYSKLYQLDTIILRPAAVFGRGHYRGGSTVGMIMRDLALNILKGQPFTIDANAYFTNEYVYAKDVAQAVALACKVSGPRQRVYNVGSGVTTSALELARTVRDSIPGLKVEVIESEKAENGRAFPLDLSRSRAELGYQLQFPLKEALRDYVKELRQEG